MITKKGCEFIAHKLTGEKGTLFTATYINRFHEMEDALAGRTAGEMESLADAIKQFMLQQEKKNAEQAELNRTLVAVVRMFMEQMDGMEKARSAGRASENPYGATERPRLEARKKELYSLTAKVAEICGISHSRTLHYLYRTLEEEMDIVLDTRKTAYISETGIMDACTVEVIAADDVLYEKAVEMNRSVIERKSIYG